MLGKKVDVVWVMVGGAIGGVFVLVAMVLSQQTRPAPIQIAPPLPTGTAVPTATPGPIRVFVSGEVGQVDVYELPAGSIVADAIRLAGDFTVEAAVERVNLAQPLVDGMQIHVPRRVVVEVETDEAQPVIQLPANGLVDAPGGAAAGGRVNINTAGLEELDTLPGVGPATAEKIMAYREENGHFARIEDIMEVSGIGEAKFEAMKDLITVDG